MSKTPIHVILRRIKRLPAFHKAAHLKALINSEPKRSIRRQELEDALKYIMTRQIRRENRAA